MNPAFTAHLILATNKHTLQIQAITQHCTVVHRLPQVTQNQVCQNGHWGPPTITQWD